MKEKKCTKCYKVKPISDFTYNRTRKQYHSHCKKCKAEHARSMKLYHREKKIKAELDDDLYALTMKLWNQVSLNN